MGSWEGGTVRTADPYRPKGTFHNIQCHAQCVKLGELTGGSPRQRRRQVVQWSLLGDRLGIVHGVVSNCIVHHLYIIIIIIIIIFSSFAFLLNCLYLNPGVSVFFFPFLLPIPLSRWKVSCVVLSCWLGLNHDTAVPTVSAPRRHTCTLFDWALASLGFSYIGWANVICSYVKKGRAHPSS